MYYDIIFILNRHDNNFSFSFRKLNKKCRNICNYYLLDLDTKYCNNININNFVYIKSLFIVFDEPHLIFNFLSKLKSFKYLNYLNTCIINDEYLQEVLHIKKLCATFCSKLTKLEQMKLYVFCPKNYTCYKKEIKHMNLYKTNEKMIMYPCIGNGLKFMYLHSLNLLNSTVISDDIKHMFLYYLYTNSLITDYALENMQLYILHLSDFFIITDDGIKHMNLCELEIGESDVRISDKVLKKMDLKYVYSYKSV